MIRQLSISDLVDVGFKDHATVERLSRLFPGWEVVGYIQTWEWDYPGRYDVDYKAMIGRGGNFKLVTAELSRYGNDRACYVERQDFEPHWFDPRGKREWVWRSIHDRENVFSAAERNRGVFR